MNRQATGNAVILMTALNHRATFALQSRAETSIVDSDSKAVALS